MKQLVIYGIKNCHTMKKTLQWLDQHKISYVFHDYKTSGADAALLKRAIRENGWEAVLNRKGLTWRGLPDKTKAAMDAQLAYDTAIKNPSIIRRPLAVAGEKMYFGFDADEYEKIFSSF